MVCVKPQILRLACAAMLFVAGLNLGGSASYAQVSRAQINGTVRDSSGAAIPQATVVLSNLETGVQTRTTTNESGVYVILQILPGPYTLEASKEGFSASRLEPFKLVVNQAPVFDLELKVGQTRESVTVMAIGSEVQSATAELGIVLTTDQVLDLPTSGSIMNLAQLSPGVSPVMTGQSSTPSVNGQINRSSIYMLDGTLNSGNMFSSLALIPIIETLSEFKVQSHNDSADVGGVMGAVINVATKSGTNELRGQVWEIEQNDAFNARNTFLWSVNPFKGHISGGVVGGPVWLPKIYNGKNRTFFFFGYQHTQTVTPALSYIRVPTAANLNGNLSDWPKPIYNPFSTRPNPNRAGTFMRDPFPRNQIPASLLQPGMVYFAKTVLPTQENIALGDYNAVNRDPNITKQHDISIRMDHRFSDRDSISGRYGGTILHETTAGPIPAMVVAREAPADNANLGWVHVFGPQTVLQTEFGRVLAYGAPDTRYRSLPSDFRAQVGYSDNLLTPYASGATPVPGFNVPNFFNATPTWVHNGAGDSWHGRVNLFRQFARHSFKVGGEYNQLGYYSANASTTINFAATQTADPVNLGTSGSPLASFLLGLPDSANRQNSTQTVPGWAGEFGVYLQDSWKATNNLTVNLGLRYDRSFIPSAGTPEAHNNMIGTMDYIGGVYVLQVPAPSCSQTGNAPCIPTPPSAPAGWLPPHVVVSKTGKLLTDTTRNFQPRLGLAYRLGPKTAIRAGAGIFFDNISGIVQLARNPNGSWPSITMLSVSSLNYPTSAQPTPSASALNPLPSTSAPAADPFSQTNYFFDPRWKNPYSIQWNVGFEHQIRSGLLAAVNYVGSGSHRTDIGGRYNVAVTPGPGDWKARQPFPYMPIPFSWDRSWGNESYHALQASLVRRWSQGLVFTASYTYSKSIDPGSSGLFGIEGFSVENPYNMRPDRSVSSFDLTHAMVLSWVYKLPFGNNRVLRSGNRVIDYVIGNWQANGIAAIRSGIPVNLTVAGDIANTGNSGYERPDVVGDWQVSNPTPKRWFNAAAFKAPAAFTFGNAGRNILRSDFVHRSDMAVFRQFPIRERIYGELRVEAYNVFNTVTYNAPVAELTNINFGRVLGAMASRSMRLNARIHF